MALFCAAGQNPAECFLSGTGSIPHALLHATIFYSAFALYTIAEKLNPEKFKRPKQFKAVVN